MRAIAMIAVLAGCRATVPPQSATPGVGWYVGENDYYATPGMADEVYRTRVEASAALAALGLAAGIVLRGPGGDGPDVIWRSAPYRDVGEVKPFNQKLMADPRFLAAFNHMATLLRHFERHRYVVMTFEAE